MKRCLMCDGFATWVRYTQFAGDHPFCEVHAKLESDFDDSDSYLYWEELKMKLCPDCDPRATCCDHCAYFEFNGNEKGEYTGNGYCRLHKRPEDPGSDCEDYHCFQLLKKEGEEQKHD